MLERDEGVTDEHLAEVLTSAGPALIAGESVVAVARASRLRPPQASFVAVTDAARVLLVTRSHVSGQGEPGADGPALRWSTLGPGRLEARVDGRWVGLSAAPHRVTGVLASAAAPSDALAPGPDPGPVDADGAERPRDGSRTSPLAARARALADRADLPATLDPVTVGKIARLAPRLPADLLDAAARGLRGAVLTGRKGALRALPEHVAPDEAVVLVGAARVEAAAGPAASGLVVVSDRRLTVFATSPARARGRRSHPITGSTTIAVERTGLTTSSLVLDDDFRVETPTPTVVLRAVEAVRDA